MSKLSYKTLLIIFFSLLIAIVALWKFVLPKQKVSASWWNDGWNYRKAVSIGNTSGSTINDQIVKITTDTSTLITAGKMQSDCDDIRVTDINGNLLDHWDTGCNTTTTNIYFKINTISTTDTTIYIYYGNPSINNDEKTLGTTENPGTSCKMMKDQGSITANGIYYVTPGGNNTDKIQVYCNTSIVGDAWTLVINNSIYATPPKPTWTNAINAVSITGTFSTDLNSFDLIVGLKHWNYLGNMALIQMGSDSNTITKRAHYSSFSLNTSNNYALTLSGQTIDLGGTAPGFYASHNGQQFTTYDADHDTYTSNCSNSYGNTPWWYHSCWNGSIWGGGDSGGYANKAFWAGAANDYYNYGGIFISGTDTMKSVSAGTLSSEEAGGGPIAYWKFDEGSGTTTYNSTGLNNGTLSGSTIPTWQTEDQCISGKCLSFSGTGYINNGNSSTFRIKDNSITIETWVKFNELDYVNNTGNLLSLVGKGHPDTAPGTPSTGFWLSYDNRNNAKSFGYTCFGNSAGGFGGGVNNFGGANYYYTFTTNTWYHLAITISQNEGRLYINGKQIGPPKTFSGLQLDNTSHDLYVGRATAGYNRGLQDDVKIYPYARSAAQIKQDYNSRGSLNGSSVNLGVQSSTAPSLNSKLVAYYKFDEGTGTTVYDSTTNQNNGTINKAIWSNQGKYNKGLSFSPNQESLLLDYRVWKAGQVGSVTGFSQNGSTSENFRVVDTDPFGRKVTVWEAAQNDVTSDSDGGWNSSNIAVDQTKMYRFSTWIRRTVLGNGTYYFGTYGKNSSGSNFGVLNRSNGAVNTNPYFRSNSGNEILSTSSWFLLVAHVWPAGSGTGSVYSDTGLYNSSGTKIATPSDFVWQDGTYYTNHRTYLYYSTDPSTIQQWAYPRIDIVDGNEPSIQELLNGYDSYGSDVSTTISDNKESFSFWYDKNSTGNWQHIVKSSSDYYVNGKLSTPEEYPIYVFGNDIFIGRTTDSDFATGLIDEVKIYNTALTPDEIKQDYNAGAATQFGATNQTIGGTTTNLEYCIPGDTSYCTNPIAEWKMDEKTGTTTKDISGNNNNGTITGATWTSGKIGAGLNFSGSSQYTTIEDNTSLKPTTTITTEAWFNTSNNSTLYQRIISKTNSGGYQLSINENSACSSSNSLCFLVNINGTYYSATYPSSNLSNNTWYHVAGSYDGTTVRLFLNGSNIGTTATVSNTITQNTAKLCIGSESAASNCYSENGFFNGKIDHVKIYNYARTPAQIAYDYNKGAPVGWWKLDDCQGLTAFDSSGLGNNAAISIGPSGTQNSAGTCQIGTSAAWTNGAIGKYNSSLNFDGTDDYTLVGDPSNGSLDFGINDFTLSSWFKLNYLPNSWTGIIHKGSAGTSGYAMDIDSSNKITASIQGISGTNQHFYGPTLSSGVWYHAVIVFTRNTDIKIYLNGKLSSSGSYSTGNNTSVDTNYPLYIGTANVNTWMFPGQIDDARIYNYALTSEQIKTVYNNGAVNFN